MIAIFGGSFDPVHFGHLNLATQVQDELEFEEFIFLPCGEPPHKEKLLFSQNKRLKILNLALNNSSKFMISDYEFNGKISYTIDTLRYFNKKYKNICFIMGSDSFMDMPNWEHYLEFKNLINILVIDRGVEITNLCEFQKTTNIDEFKNTIGKVYFFKNELINISSTIIRSKILQQENLSGFVPENIIKYIKNL